MRKGRRIGKGGEQGRGGGGGGGGLVVGESKYGCPGHKTSPAAARSRTNIRTFPKTNPIPAEQQIWLVESIRLVGGCCCSVTRLPNDFAELVFQLYKLLEISTEKRSQDFTDKAKIKVLLYWPKCSHAQPESLLLLLLLKTNKMN